LYFSKTYQELPLVALFCQEKLQFLFKVFSPEASGLSGLDIGFQKNIYFTDKKFNS